jgi:uncharacterized membrane protein
MPMLTQARLKLMLAKLMLAKLMLAKLVMLVMLVMLVRATVRATVETEMAAMVAMVAMVAMANRTFSPGQFRSSVQQKQARLSAVLLSVDCVESIHPYS